MMKPLTAPTPTAAHESKKIGLAKRQKADEALFFGVVMPPGKQRVFAPEAWMDAAPGCARCSK
jgi:hypothetical protein